MLGFLTASDELVPVDEDPDVQKATERLLVARGNLDALETKERRMIRVVTGREDDYTDEEFADAHQRLGIEKGTQNKWFFPDAYAARDEVQQAVAEHRTAVAAAQERLRQASETRLIQLVKDLDAALVPARALAQEIETLRQAVNGAGVKPFEHPARVLLPGELLEFQMRNCRTRGWI